MMYSRLEDKLLAHISFPEDLNNCWIWLGAKQKTGHGKFYWRGHYTSSYRAMYRAFVNPDIQGLDVDHLCKNPECMNLNHLEAVTSRVNTLRGSSPPAVNSSKTECKKGHPFTEENTRINKSGGRGCKECGRARWRRAYHRDPDKFNKLRNARRARA